MPEAAPMGSRLLKIGVSPRLFHPQPEATGIQSRTLQYLEQSVAHWIMSGNALVFMVPTVDQEGVLHRSDLRPQDYAQALDALVLQGGADLSPGLYGERSLDAGWVTDGLRDAYEIELLEAFAGQGKPVLGICRGAQLINVAFGGSLIQDIATQIGTAAAHVTPDYERNRHPVRFLPGSSLDALYGGQAKGGVVSIHHQAVRRLGSGLRIEAVSPADGIIEAIRGTGPAYLLGIQWHPEFHRPGDASALDCKPILDEFLSAAARGAGSGQADRGA
jgi:putative glutamine amidotransferase